MLRSKFILVCIVILCGNCVGVLGQDDLKDVTCDDLHSYPAASRCAIIKQSCPSESKVPYQEWFYCHVVPAGATAQLFYLLLVLPLLPLFFCLLGDTADWYFSPIMAGISQSIPKMRPRFAGVTFVALGNGAPDLSSNIMAIKQGDILLSAGALTGAAMFVQCIVTAELLRICDGVHCRGATLRDVGIYAVSITTVLITFATGQVTPVFVGCAITIYVVYVVWVFCGDEWHERGRPSLDISLPMRYLERVITNKREGGRMSVGEEMEESLLPWADAEDVVSSELSVLDPYQGQTHTQAASNMASLLPGGVSGAHEDSHGKEPIQRGSIEAWVSHHQPAASPVASPSAMLARHQGTRGQVVGRPGRGVSSGGWIDARTYQQLVWADLGGELDEAISRDKSWVEVEEREGTYLPPEPFEFPSESEGGVVEDGLDHQEGGNRAGDVVVPSALQLPAWPEIWQQLKLEVTMGQCAEWEEAGIVGRMFRRCTYPVLLPFYLALRTTIPFADQSGYSPQWMVVAVLGFPLVAIVYLGLFRTIYVVIAIVMAVLLAIAAHKVTAGTDEMPPLNLGGFAVGPAMVSVMGFFVGVVWIDTFATEVVGLLTFLATLCNIPSSLLGLTLMAGGNSIGDFFGNPALARKGMASTALTACFASPLFTLLWSLSLGFSSLFAAKGVHSVRVELTPEVLLGCVFLLVHCMCIITVGLLFGYHIPRRFYLFSRLWYSCYFILACTLGLLKHWGKL